MSKKIKSPIRPFVLKYNKKARQLFTSVTIFNPKNHDKKITGNFLWDTGATNTSINSKLIKDLDLYTEGITNVSTANGLTQSEVKKIDILLPQKIMITQIPASTVDFHQDPLLGLIGMDIISQGSFLIQNNNNKTVFQFSLPSLEKLNDCDFLNLSYIENEKTVKKIKKYDPKHPSIKGYSVRHKIKI